MVQDVNKLPDTELVRRIKEDACSDSFTELASRHSDLFYKVCQNHINILFSVGYNPKDIFEERDVVMLEAAQKFKTDKGALFSTWLGNYSRYFCLNKINKAKGIPKQGSLEEMETVFDTKSVEDFEGSAPALDLQTVFNALSQVDDTRIYEVFRMRYDAALDKKRTWSVIAKKLNLTVQTTMQLHKKGLKLLREEIEKNNLDVFKDAVVS